jgi:hypothetical protein
MATARDRQCIFLSTAPIELEELCTKAGMTPKHSHCCRRIHPASNPSVESLHPKDTGQFEMISHRSFCARQFDGSKGYMGTAFREPNNLISTSCGQAIARPRIFPADPIAKHTAKS